MSNGIHHGGLTVNNLEESLAWYQEKLGFEVVKKYTKSDVEIAFLKRGNAHLELFDYKSETKSLPDYRTSFTTNLQTVGVSHFCIEVQNLDQIVSELKGKGIEFVAEIDTAFFGGRFAFLKDCNGIFIELFQP